MKGEGVFFLFFFAQPLTKNNRKLHTIKHKIRIRRSVVRIALCIDPVPSRLGQK